MEAFEIVKLGEIWHSDAVSNRKARGTPRFSYSALAAHCLGFLEDIWYENGFEIEKPLLES